MRNFSFRFCFLLFLFFISPWNLAWSIPGASVVMQYVGLAEEAVVSSFNAWLWQVKPVLNVNGNGSGDTSFAWALLATHLLLAVVGALVWTALDWRRQRPYTRLQWVLANLVRYYLAVFAFSYGIIKLFAQQMPFPSLSQLATPLGDYLPMRLSWMFFGYSTPYQVFSGAVETLVGCLLMYRRTTTLGALLGLAVFTNVFMINLAYDVPVKIFSFQLMLAAAYLVSLEGPRLWQFFVANQPTAPSVLYRFSFTKPWGFWTRRLAKLALFTLFVVMPFYQSWQQAQEPATGSSTSAVPADLYRVQALVRNDDTLRMGQDTVAWANFIFEADGLASVPTRDSLFRLRYGRGYFYAQPKGSDSLLFYRSLRDSTVLMRWQMQWLADSSLVLTTQHGGDSLRYWLRPARKKFPLADRPFHWLSEANR